MCCFPLSISNYIYVTKIFFPKSVICLFHPPFSL
jgi:hypothetical protein